LLVSTTVSLAWMAHLRRCLGGLVQAGMRVRAAYGLASVYNDFLPAAVVCTVPATSAPIASMTGQSSVRAHTGIAAPA
jgi:hypothetical protein